MGERIVSFAQNAEDVVLHRAFGLDRPGFYVDVGANHPVIDSVTKLFSDAGWRGVNIEPQSALFDELVSARPRDINLNVGISDRPGTLTLNQIEGSDGLATFDPTLLEMYQGMGRRVVDVTVPVVTLTTVCDEHVDGEIDFLKIDVEGHEAQVLEGLDFGRIRPRVIVIEATFPERWEHLLERARYRFAMYDGINRFYVRDEDAAELGPRIASPATIALDGFDPYHYVAQLRGAAAEIERLTAVERSLSARMRELDAENDVLRRAWLPIPVRRLGGRILRRLGLRAPLPSDG